jgi:hypothetical protein
MARTYHHLGKSKAGWGFPNRAPAWHRRDLNRLYRRRVAHLVRLGRFERVTPPKRDASWFW